MHPDDETRAHRLDAPRELGNVTKRAPLLPLGAAELRYCSPTLRSRATGTALGYAPLAQPALRDCDMGRWRGFTLGEAMAREPSAVDAWLADPQVREYAGGKDSAGNAANMQFDALIVVRRIGE